MNTCLHCRTPVPAHLIDQQFCCTGCAYVYDLLHKEGLDKFYDLRGGGTLPPVPMQAMREADFTWLKELVEDAETDAEPGHSVSLHLGIQGMSCMGCVWLVEKLFKSQPGAVRININPARGDLHVVWHSGEFDAVAFAVLLQQYGYLTGKDNTGVGIKADVHGVSFARRVGLCGAFAMNAMAFSLPAYLGMGKDFMFAPLFDMIAAATATLSLLVGGSYFAERSFRSLKLGMLHMDTPITLGILAAWIGSMVGWQENIATLKYFDFVSIFIFLMLAGRWMQESALEKNRRRLLKTSAVPETVLMKTPAGELVKTGLQDIKAGDRLSLPGGAVCPVGAVLTQPQATLSLEWINGESQAAVRQEGQVIPSGSLNIGTQPIEVAANEAWKDSLLFRLTKARSEDVAGPGFSDKLLRVYLSVVVLIGIIGGAVWLWNGHGVGAALQVMISVFVVSCPCALGVAGPFADDLAASWMEKLGVFVRSTGVWQRLVRVKNVMFDKTGTLTLENPILNEQQRLASLSTIERQSLHHLVASNLHPVSRSLFDALGPKNMTEADKHTVDEITGMGLHFTDEAGRTWSLGRPGWRGGFCAEMDIGMVSALADADVEFCLNDNPIAGFSFTDSLRPDTVQAVNKLKYEGYIPYLLSGDRPEKVSITAHKLNLPASHWKANMTPLEKAEQVRELNHDNTLFIGDGANDSLAFDAALCSGSPVTGRNFLEHKADFYFLGNSLRFVPRLLEVAWLRKRAVTRVFTFALLYNTVAVGLSLAGWMSPLLAAILMPASSVVTLAMVRATFGGTQKRQNTSLLKQAGNMEPLPTV